MWRPDEVVPRHKRRAVALWALLIVSICAYTSYLVFKAFEKANNPDTSFSLSNEVYRYPDLSMCLFDYYGCDEKDLEEACVASANYTEGGTVKAVYNPGGEYEQHISNYYTLTNESGWCVIFKTSEVVTELYNTRNPGNYLDYILLDMYWYPGGSPNNSTTCISEDGMWKEHSESMFAFLNDTTTDAVSTGIQVPYTCMTNKSTSYTFTYVGIGLTKEQKLDSSNDMYSYRATDTSSATYKVKQTADITEMQAPYAYVAMEFAQQFDSLEVITDIDPFEIAELLGSVGGFWDLILIFWPIFFVAAERHGPVFKFRNFKESLGNATDNARTVASSLASKTSSRGVRSESMTQEEERPSWDRTSSNQKEEVVLIRLFDEHGLVAVVDGARIKRFLKSRFNATSLKDGATEPVLKKLLPENTYLVVVPPATTTRAIAKTISGHCSLGGDNVETVGARPIGVKVKQAQCSVLQAHTLSISEYVVPNDDIGDELDVDLDGVEPFQGPIITRPERRSLVRQPLEAEGPRRKMYFPTESGRRRFLLGNRRHSSHERTSSSPDRHESPHNTSIEDIQLY